MKIALDSPEVLRENWLKMTLVMLRWLKPPRTDNSWATVAGRNQLNGNYQGTLHNGVRPHNPRRPSALIYGNARTGADDSEQFLAADAELVAYGVSKDATEEQLKQFIISKGINVTAVKKLTTFEEARTFTFRVSIKVSDYEKALKPEVWPLRVGVRPFRPKRTNNPTQSWAQQSASSSGFVQQGVIFPVGAWVFPTGNLDNLTGHLSVIPRVDVVFLYFPQTINEMYRK